MMPTAIPCTGDLHHRSALPMPTGIMGRNVEHCLEAQRARNEGVYAWARGEACDRFIHRQSIIRASPFKLFADFFAKLLRIGSVDYGEVHRSAPALPTTSNFYLCSRFGVLLQPRLTHSESGGLASSRSHSLASSATSRRVRGCVNQCCEAGEGLQHLI